MRQPIDVAPNGIGLTKFSYTEPGGGQVPLEEQLDRVGVAFERIDIPHIVGMGGTAYLICYHSPKSGQDVTVLLTPHQYDVDAFGTSHYFFEGLSAEEARRRDWIADYDTAKTLVR